MREHHKDVVVVVCDGAAWRMVGGTTLVFMLMIAHKGPCASDEDEGVFGEVPWG